MLDDELPLNKTIEIPSMIIVIRAVFYENNKYYPQVFVDECFYKLWIIQKCYDTIEVPEGIDVNNTSKSKAIFISTKRLQWMSWFINDAYEF